MKIAKYKKYQTTPLILFLFFIACMPELELPEAPGPVTEMPEFEQFAIPEYQIYKDKPRPVNLVSHPRALRFKDRLIHG
ncbi:MAG: hypothetical protein F4032_01790, partial [Gemmatimonadetes bacterium]|nr:hypothetical protein [Gemmatimonadota bacterium]